LTSGVAVGVAVGVEVGAGVGFFFDSAGPAKRITVAITAPDITTMLRSQELPLIITPSFFKPGRYRRLASRLLLAR